MIISVISRQEKQCLELVIDLRGLNANILAAFKLSAL